MPPCFLMPSLAAPVTARPGLMPEDSPVAAAQAGEPPSETISQVPSGCWQAAPNVSFSLPPTVMVCWQ